MEYNNIISVIPQQWHKHMKDNQIATPNKTSTDKLTQIITLPQKQVSKFVTSNVISTKANIVNLETQVVQSH